MYVYASDNSARENVFKSAQASRVASREATVGGWLMQVLRVVLYQFMLWAMLVLTCVRCGWLIASMHADTDALFAVWEAKPRRNSVALSSLWNS